jgi:tetratricopeptide (TPR) repeat protein
MRNFKRERARGKGTHWGARVAALAAMLLLPLGFASAQASLPEAPSNFPFTLTGPEAVTPEELDAFGFVMEATLPSNTIARAEAFIREFPDSQLLSLAQLREMKAEIDANSYEGAVAVGHELLRRNPNNLEALILMAGVLPNFLPSYPDARKANALKEAREDIQTATQLLQTFHLMEGIPARAFLTNKQNLRISLKQAAAFVDLASGNYERAIQEYQAVLAENPTPPAVISFRLGIAYYHAGQVEKARAQLERAMQVDTGIIGKRAASLLKEIASKPNSLHQSPAGPER